MPEQRVGAANFTFKNAPLFSPSSNPYINNNSVKVVGPLNIRTGAGNETDSGPILGQKAEKFKILTLRPNRHEPAISNGNIATKQLSLITLFVHSTFAEHLQMTFYSGHG